MHKGFFAEDIRKERSRAPWSRVGGLGAYLNLEGSEGVNELCLHLRHSSGQSLNAQKHLFEGLVCDDLAVHGAMTVVVEGRRQRSKLFEWQEEGSLFLSAAQYLASTLQWTKEINRCARRP